MNTATQLKALIRNISKEKKVNAQILLRNYMLEGLLERISISKYKYNFILKGGMLIAAIVGMDTRSTMDMDATIKGVPVSKETIKEMFDEILLGNINKKLLVEALNKTAKKRGALALFDNKDLIVSEILSSSILQDLWSRYREKYYYAEDVLWSDVMSAVESSLNIRDGS